MSNANEIVITDLTTLKAGDRIRLTVELNSASNDTGTVGEWVEEDDLLGRPVRYLGMRWDRRPGDDCVLYIDPIFGEHVVTRIG